MASRLFLTLPLRLTRVSLGGGSAGPSSPQSYFVSERDSATPRVSVVSEVNEVNITLVSAQWHSMMIIIAGLEEGKFD